MNLNLNDVLPFRNIFGKTPDERRPSRWLMLLEGRALLELSTLPLAMPWLMSRVPKGDGHTVLVLPGLMADDNSTIPLRRFLNSRGYPTSGWGQGVNLGPRRGVLTHLRQTLADLHAQSGRKVSIVGWSLGGVYAREMARESPGNVRQAISLGSPLYGHPDNSSNASQLYKFVSGRNDVDPGERGDGPPPGVPMTAIFTRSDGIVGWGCSIEKKGPLSDNIEIVGASHSGLGVHPLALYAIGDRLAQPEDGWKHFKPTGPERALYPADTPSR